MTPEQYPDITKDPNALKSMSYDEVAALCEETRQLLIKTASINGGHLASNLGVVELTMALHRVFNTPTDQIVFDVGHQCYTHKLLTGRAAEFSTIRTENGLAGFPKPNESIYDPIVTGHSSTSISAACGLARAKSVTGQKGTVVAVIGDGALTGGLAYEGLNNAGRCRDNIVVVLNDNKMSISKNVGAMARYLAVIRSKTGYVRMKTRTVKLLESIPLIGKPFVNFLFRSKSLVKNAIYQNTLFDALGFAYLGPIDGHNQRLLEQTLNIAKSLRRPTLVHVCTIKGKGYDYAERFPSRFHGIGRFDIDTGEPKHSAETYSGVFGRVMCDIAREDGTVYAITAAMKSGTGLEQFSAENHQRFYDCGIAEEHAVTFSSGLASNGIKPVFAVYSSFIQRAYDQIVHDVAIAGLNVTFAIDRAGVVGEDGETHHGLFDCAMLNTIPGMYIYSPCYFSELEAVLRECIAEDGPAAIRYPRGVEPSMPDDLKLNPGTPYTLYGESSGDVLLVTYGRIAAGAFEAMKRLNQNGIRTTVLLLCRIKPLDKSCCDIVNGFSSVYFFEEGIKQSGINETFLSLITENGYTGRYSVRAVDNSFVTHASVARLLQKLGLDADGMYDMVAGGESNDK